MTSYDEQYQVEEALFGEPYPEFVAFVKAQGKAGGRALDLGCGQGRDALMLARYGYQVTGVDSSPIGIAQMVERANRANLDVVGVVADLFEYELQSSYDVIVLDSILHFGKAGKERELTLLDSLVPHVNVGGYLALFVHKSAEKERVLKRWAAGTDAQLSIVEEAYIDYVYQESASGFQSAFQYLMLILKRS